MDSKELNDITEQLDGYGRSLAHKLDQFLGSTDPELEQTVKLTSGLIALKLVDGDYPTAVLLRDLIGKPCGGGEIDPDFWRTPVGQRVARIAGYGPNEQVIPRKHAAAMLGISRQRISQLEAEGALSATSAGIIAATVMHRLSNHGYQGGSDDDTGE